MTPRLQNVLNLQKNKHIYIEQFLHNLERLSGLLRVEGWEPLGQRVKRALSFSLIILSGYIMNVSSMCTTAHTAVMSVPHVHPSGLHRSGSLFIRPGSVKRPLKMLCLVQCFVFLHWESDHWYVRVRTVVYDAYCMSMRSTPLISFAFSPRIPRQHCHVNFGVKKKKAQSCHCFRSRRVLQSVASRISFESISPSACRLNVALNVA